jgi:cytoskeletal protein CcmA (bactofilin family)
MVTTNPLTNANPAPATPMSPVVRPEEPRKPAVPSSTLPDLSSVVSTGSSWQGSLKVEGSVRVEGKLSGEVDAGELVFVAETAEVDAELRAATVVIAGRFKGKVQSRERLEIMPTGKVSAELTTKSLVVHDGAFVEGQVHMSEKSDLSKENKDKAIDKGVEVLRAAAKT